MRSDIRKLLWWLIGGTKGGETRYRVIQQIREEPMNANQLAENLELDYKTVKHHVELLEEESILETMGEGYGKNYFLTDMMEENTETLERIAEKAGLKA